MGLRVHAPVNFQAFIQNFCLIFPANNQILHPSIEIFNPETTFLSIFPANGQILHPSIEISNKGTVSSLSLILANTYSYDVFLVWKKNQ